MKIGQKQSINFGKLDKAKIAAFKQFVMPLSLTNCHLYPHN